MIVFIHLISSSEKSDISAFSSEQVAGRYKMQGKEMVSYETLYKWIWYEKRHGNKELSECLRHQGRKYAKRGATNRSRGIIKDRIGAACSDGR